MDLDPFAVWDDPTPASTSSTSDSAAAAKPSTHVSDAEAILGEVRTSLEYEDEDPGWGFASASASRAKSPEKSRKQPPSSQIAAAVSLVSEVKDIGKTPELISALVQEDSESNGSALAADETSAIATTEADPTATAAPAAEKKIEPTATAEEEESDEDIDTFEDSRQEQAELVQDGILPQEFEEKATIAADADDDDGFDDFGEPAPAAEGAAAHDDFGDFDDFETGDAQNDADFGDNDFGDDAFDQRTDNTQQAAASPVAAQLPAVATATRTWAPLDVTTKSNRVDLADAVNALLPLSTAAEQNLSTAGLRQVEGPSQVLVSAESRQLYSDLSSFPSVRPIDWVRSRTRRDYLISMGVPVNLDEIHSSFASGSGGSRQLPPLQLKYDSSANRASGANGSLPQRSSSLKVSGTALSTPTSSSSAAGTAAQRSASASNTPRNGNSSPALGSSTNRERIAERRMQELGLGPAPQVDLRRAQELVSKTEDQLTLLSLPALKSMLRELNTMTTSTSNLLTHHLTLRESYQADSEMYNSMIKELVTGAASRFSGGGGSGSAGGSNSVAGGRGDSRRSTTMGINASNSGKARVSSLPAASAAMTGTRSMSPSLRGGAGSSPRR
ncbi:hypothetical protein EX895_001978 [Sporisorium graminicola]|uniref:Uncharacterized protein n=1 Tax=Sporisorium graminicola TaxID=280036 RepID=A0A4U7KYT6_9BASI|nr:hypothetical protein EX895_001978 [Sporisorium graminicola]TKY89447.1 hypothetical protein EX895_001978 [Sporisorium graminicola]